MKLKHVNKIEYLSDVTRFKPSIDLQQTYCEKVSETEIEEGHLKQSIYQNLFENNVDEYNLHEGSPLEVLIIPKLTQEKRRIESDDPDGTLATDYKKAKPLYIVPAILSPEGELTTPKYPDPYIPYNYLGYFDKENGEFSEEVCIGSTEPHSFNNTENSDWQGYWRNIKKYYAVLTGNDGVDIWDKKFIEDFQDKKSFIYPYVEGDLICYDSRVDSTFHIKKLYGSILQCRESVFQPLDKEGKKGEKETEDDKKKREKIYNNYKKKHSQEDSNFLALLNGILNPVDHNTEYHPYDDLDFERMKDHYGVMNNEFPLAVSQRESIHHLDKLKTGEVLAVSGPPGTGKTTLLQSVVADLLVHYALDKEDAPIIAATSANNKAITNIIDSFTKVLSDSFKEDDLLGRRWINISDTECKELTNGKKVVPLAVYNATEKKANLDSNKGYFVRGGRDDIKSMEDNWKDFEKGFSDNAIAYYKDKITPSDKYIKIMDVIHGELEDKKNSLASIIDILSELKNELNIPKYEKEYNRFEYTPEKIINNINQEHLPKTDLEKEEKTLASLQDRVSGTEKRLSELKNKINSLPKLSILEKIKELLGIGKDKGDLRIQQFLNKEEQNGIRLPLSKDAVVDYYNILIKGQNKKVDDQKEVVYKLNREIDSFEEYKQNRICKIKSTIKELEEALNEAVDYKKALRQITGKGIHPAEHMKFHDANGNTVTSTDDLYQVRIQDINGILDITLRYQMFWLAVHYYEAKWLYLMYKKDKEDSQKGSPYEKVSNELHRYACLTPCTVVTFYRLPNVFKTNDNWRFPYFTDIDLLVVDEAGQVSPEIAMPSFALAKKAIVVGDVNQIPPVWKFKDELEKYDYKIAQKKGVITKDIEFNDFKNLPLNCSSSSIMAVAQSACHYTRNSGIGGLFLSEHRRCYDEIIDYSNKLLYKNLLLPRKSNFYSKDKKLDDGLYPMSFISCEHQTADKQEGGGTSRYNHQEAESIVKWICLNFHTIVKFYTKIKDGKVEKPKLDETICVITPFSRQAREIREAIANIDNQPSENLSDLTKKEKEAIKKIKVGTVHTFQGAEAKIVIFSSVYGKDDGWNFLRDFPGANILNVAVSRAKEYIILCGQRMPGYSKDIKNKEHKTLDPVKLLMTYTEGHKTPEILHCVN